MSKKDTSQAASIDARQGLYAGAYCKKSEACRQLSLLEIIACMSELRPTHTALGVFLGVTFGGSILLSLAIGQQLGTIRI